METIAEYNELKIPTYALCYLVNGDPSGLEDNEIKDIDNYMAFYEEKAKELGGSMIFSPENEEEYFSHSPEFGLPCTVTDCAILILK